MRHVLVSSSAILTGALIFGAVLTAGSAGLADANSREGCMNQWLFNGVWRVEVTKVEPYMNAGQQTGWQVTEVWRNGSTQELSPFDSVLKDETLELSNGSVQASATNTGSMSMNGVSGHSFAPAAQFTYTQVFVALSLDPSNKPKAVDIVFDEAKLATF